MQSRIILFSTTLGFAFVAFAGLCSAQNTVGTNPQSSGSSSNSSAAYATYECDLSGNGPSDDSNLKGCVNTSGGGFVTSSNPLSRNPNNVNPVPACGSNGSYCGARTDANSSAITPINAWGVCQWIDNKTNTSLFVPFGSAIDWTSFINNAPGNNNNDIVVTNCALPQNYMGPSGTIMSTSEATIPAPYTGCGTAPTITPAVYGKAGQSIWPYPASTPTNATYPSPSFVCANATITSSLQWGVGASETYWTLYPNFSPNLTLTASGSNAVNTPGYPANTNISVLNGTQVTLTWGPTNSTASSYSNSSNWGTNVKATSGTQKVIPTSSPSVYTLSTTNVVPNRDNTTTALTSQASVTINLVQNIVVNLQATPASVNAGTPVTLTWTITPPTGIAVTCTGISTDGSWSNDPTASGTQSVTPNLSSGDVTYTLSCSDSYESNVTSSAIVTIASVPPAQCGTATVDSSGNLQTGQLCAVGTASTVTMPDGSYTCTSGTGASANIQNCTATLAAGSGNADVEIEQYIADSHTIAGGGYLEGYVEIIVPTMGCTPGENFYVTGSTVNGLPSSQWNVQVNDGEGDVDQIAKGWQYLAENIVGMTLQCQTLTTYYGVSFPGFAYANSRQVSTAPMPAMTLGVVTSSGSGGAITPNTHFLSTVTNWSGP